MTNHSEFHDGSLSGFLTDGATVRVFLRTERGENCVALATGVHALAGGGFRSGSIIFEVLIREQEEVTAEDIGELYDLIAGPERVSQSERLLANVKLKALKILEINPSYGGSLIILAESIEIVPHDMAPPML